jgi:hypothetical protein
MASGPLYVLAGTFPPRKRDGTRRLHLTRKESAHMLLKDTSTVAAEILDGTWDDQLHNLSRAINFRQKMKAAEKGFMPRQRVRIANDPAMREIAGKVAIVEKVNQKTVTIHLEENEFASYRISPDFLERVEETAAA